MKPLTQDALEDDLVFTLHQRGDAMTRSQASALIYFLHKKTYAQPYWQEVGRDGAPRWQKHLDYARLKAVSDGLIIRPSRGDKGV